MERREMKKLGIETSLLGFGCMRFPTLSDGSIDEGTAEKMLDAAYEAGVNYFDTAYVYHDGKSEGMVGKALAKRDRSTYFIATKLPIWLLKKQEDTVRIFTEQLERLQKDYVDFYLLHALDKETFETVKELHVIKECEELRRQGKIRYLGFSFHDSYEVFEEILNYYPWDFCQIQYNYMDTEIQAGDRGYALAEQMGIPMVIMEPVRGGSLAGFSEDIDEKFHALDPDASIASYAVRWVGSHPNVKVILSGMSTMEQVEDNCGTCSDFKPLSDAENAMLKDVVATMRGRVQNGCTGCRYCMPCPAGVNIPGNFRVWNEFHIYGNYKIVQSRWEKQLDEKEKPHNCIACGKCEEVCPQQLAIRDDLKKVQQDLDQAREQVYG